MYLGLTGKTITGIDTVKYGYATNYIKHEDIPNLKRDIVNRYKDVTNIS